MFGRRVTIDGQEIWVSCVPKTPLSEVLRRAAEIMKKKEMDADERDPASRAYKEAVARAFSNGEQSHG